MFLVTYYNANMQFPIFSENPLLPFQKINPPHNTTPLQNQNGVHARTLPKQLAPQQITNLQTMTA